MNGLVILLLAHAARIKELLDLLLRIPSEVLPELLKPLQHIVPLWCPMVHIVIKRIHPCLLSGAL